MIDFTIKIGQLLPYERKLLYSFVLRYKPETVLEVGTGLGGSAYFIVSALKENSKGHLYSCDPRLNKIHSFFYDSDQVSFYKMRSDELIPLLISRELIPDFIFFDGPEDPAVALEDFKLLDKYLKKGTIFSMHDWCTKERKFDKGVSVKAASLRPYLSSLKDWKSLLELDGTAYCEGEDTVGIVFAEKIKVSN